MLKKLETLFRNTTKHILTVCLIVFSLKVFLIESVSLNVLLGESIIKYFFKKHYK